MTDELATVDVRPLPGGVTLATVVGEIDMSNVVAVETRITATRPSSLVLDLSGVGFLDTQGLRMLHQLAASAAHLVVVAPPGSIARELLDLTELSSQFTVQDTVDG